MKLKKLLVLACVFGMLFANLLSFSANAAETAELQTASASTVGSVNGIAATGLIQLYSLSCSAGTSRVYISAKTIGTETMAKIGFIDIEIQRSSNGYSGWTTVKTPADLLLYNTDSYELNKYGQAVTGGYYYRVHLTHYAKETGWFFPGTQTISAYSGVVWVPAS